MYENLDESEGTVQGYEIRDEISEEEIEELLYELEEVIHEEGEVRVLVHVPTFPSFEVEALDEDLGFWFLHGDDIERYAVVGDSKLMEWVVALEDRFVDIDIRYFDGEEIDDAWEWLREDE